MKTEDVRMTEITMGPFTTLILFSAPGHSKAADHIQPKLTGDTPVFAAAIACNAAWRDSNGRVALLQGA